MSYPFVSQASAVVTAVCAAAFLGLAVFTAMAHEKPWIVGACAACALGSIVLTNFQLQIVHTRKAAKDAETAPPA